MNKCKHARLGVKIEHVNVEQRYARANVYLVCRWCGEEVYKREPFEDPVFPRNATFKRLEESE